MCAACASVTTQRRDRQLDSGLPQTNTCSLANVMSDGRLTVREKGSPCPHSRELFQENMFVVQLLPIDSPTHTEDTFRTLQVFILDLETLGRGLISVRVTSVRCARQLCADGYDYSKCPCRRLSMRGNPGLGSSILGHSDAVPRRRGFCFQFRFLFPDLSTS